MRDKITYRIADKNDLAAIAELLRQNGLPKSDIQHNHIGFIIATNNENAVIGSIGIEHYGTDGLLRSFAVHKAYRDKKIGGQLFERLLSYGRQMGVDSMHLLTTTAEKYFSARGFSVLPRESAPGSIRSTSEFTTLCSSSSTYMVMKNMDAEAACYYADVQKMKIDKETGSPFWSVKGKNLQFTWFEVPPNKKFAKHKHNSEQITYVLEGELFFSIENGVHKLSKGDGIVIPVNKEHEVWTEGLFAKAVDAWSPINENYRAE